MQILKLNDDPKIITHVSKVVGDLSRLNTSMNQFNGVREYIGELLKIEKWGSLNYKELEEIRMLLRDLMKYKSKKTKKNCNDFIKIR